MTPIPGLQQAHGLAGGSLSPAEPLGSVLLVDSEASSRARLRHMLAGCGLHVIDADSIAAASAAASKLRFAYAIIELRLRDGYGLTLLRQLRVRHASMRIVIVTRFDSFATVVQAMAGGAANYLVKPVAEAELMDALIGCEPAIPAVPETPLGVDRVCWEHLQRIFEQCGRNVTETARCLGMHRRSVQRMLGRQAPCARRSCTNRAG